jgi:hypothetical protein
VGNTQEAGFSRGPRARTQGWLSLVLRITSTVTC